jgi:hypothetical protein
MSLELFIADPEPILSVYREALGYRLRRRESGWIEMGKDGRRLILNSQSIDDPAHPFRGWESRESGVGVEIIEEVENVERVYASVQERSGLGISSLELREWGCRDFRIRFPSGHYLRITEFPEQ